MAQLGPGAKHCPSVQAAPLPHCDTLDPIASAPHTPTQPLQDEASIKLWQVFLSLCKAPPLLCEDSAILVIFFQNLGKKSLSKAILGHCHEPLRSIKASWLSSVRHGHTAIAGSSFLHCYCISVQARETSIAFAITFYDCALNALGKQNLGQQGREPASLAWSWGEQHPHSAGPFVAGAIT